MNDKFILNDHGEPIPESNLNKWALWFERSNRKVRIDDFGELGRVSTVFLSIDHSYGESANPILWETMVFGGPLDQEQERCSGTREQAEAMHETMCMKVRAAK